jgi:G:T/U-mismatch repair DNA glycosylase
MEIGSQTRTVISKGRKQKRCNASLRMKDTQMVVVKTYVGAGRFKSQTKHELK